MNNVVVRKFQSVQSPNFTATNNLVDIVLPRGGVNLDKSKVNVLIRVATTDADTSTGKGVYNYEFTYNNGNYPFDNIAMVRNCNLHSSQYGRLADVREVRAVRQQLNNFSMSLGEKQSSGFQKLRTQVNLNNIRVGSGLELYRTGVNKSINNLLEIPIPVSQLFNLGNVENLPTDKMSGDTTIHLELGLDKIFINQLQGELTRETQFGNVAYTEFEDEVNNEASSVEITSVITKTIFKNPCDSPFYVGQKLKFSFANPGLSATAVITSIEERLSNRLTLTLDRSIYLLPAGDTLTPITCDGVDAGSISYEVVGVELECEYAPSSGSVDTLRYTTWRTEETNGNNLEQYRNLFTCEPECMNVMLLLPNASDLFCIDQEDYNSYRFRIDGVGDLTNRNVDVGSGLYYDRINMTMLQHGVRLDNLVRVPDQTSSYDRQSTEEASVPNKLFFAGNPTPITNDTKLLQVEVNCKTGKGVGRIILAKELLRIIEL